MLDHIFEDLLPVAASVMYLLANLDDGMAMRKAEGVEDDALFLRCNRSIIDICIFRSAWHWLLLLDDAGQTHVGSLYIAS